MNTPSSSNHISRIQLKSEAEISQRLTLLGITDSSEMELLSILLQRPNMVGEMQSVVLGTARKLGEAPDIKTLTRIEEAAQRLVARKLLGCAHNPEGMLYYLHGEIWNKSITEIKAVMLELYSLIKENGNLPIDLNSVSKDLLNRLNQNHNIQISGDSIHRLTSALVRERIENSLRLTSGTKGEGICWNGTLDELSARIEELSEDLNSLMDVAKRGTTELETEDDNTSPLEASFSNDLETERDDLEIFTPDFIADDEQTPATTNWNQGKEEGVEAEERIPSGDISVLIGTKDSEAQAPQDYEPNQEKTPANLYSTVADIMTPAPITWSQIDIGACYCIPRNISGRPTRETTVYLIDTEDTYGKCFVLLSFICPAKEEKQAMKLLDEIRNSRFGCCTTSFLGRDFLALKCPLPFTTEPAEVTRAIIGMASEVDRLKDTFFAGK